MGCDVGTLVGRNIGAEEDDGANVGVIVGWVGNLVGLTVDTRAVIGTGALETG